MTLLSVFSLFGQSNQDSTDVDSGISKSFLEFEKTENERQLFIKEMIELDSILEQENYLDNIKLFKPKKLSVTLKDNIIKLDFPQIFCVDYFKLRKQEKINNIERLRVNDKLVVYCRDIASDLDIFPKRTGNIEEDCKIYLKTIKQLLSKNQNILEGFNYKKYIQLEKSRNIKTHAKRFVFRKRFLKFLNEEYYVSI
ncbi:hypothetical protein BFR04_15400 [Gaetbulibacter sp. 4G1]|nr:hypothetical protein BFR04_15400 [Gaetbulibacter sp. 4G1]